MLITFKFYVISGKFLEQVVSIIQWNIYTLLQIRGSSRSACSATHGPVCRFEQSIMASLFL